MLEHIGVGIKKLLLETGQKRVDEQRKWRDSLLESGVPSNSDKIVRINEEIASIKKQMDEVEQKNVG
jgi:hypothetical protein